MAVKPDNRMMVSYHMRSVAYCGRHLNTPDKYAMFHGISSQEHTLLTFLKVLLTYHYIVDNEQWYLSFMIPNIL